MLLLLLCSWLFALPESVIPSLPEIVRLPAFNLRLSKFRLKTIRFSSFLAESRLAYRLLMRPPTHRALRGSQGNEGRWREQLLETPISF
jgi:hypothetical protein